VSLPVVYVEWTVPNSIPGAIPGKCKIAGLLQGNTETSLTICQSEHTEAGATSGGCEIAWEWVTAAYNCATTGRLYPAGNGQEDGK
jgi:hypothetical protein